MAGIDKLTNGAKSAGIMVLVVAVVLAILETFQGSSTAEVTTVINATTNVTTNVTTGTVLTYQGAAYNAVGTGITAIDDFITWLGIVILVIVGAYLLKKVSATL